jgi:fructose-bisphosphate aldolase class II
MKTLRQIIAENMEGKTAVGHFNFSTFDVAQAIVNAAKSLNVPVILGLSEGERDFVGFTEAVAWVKSENQDLDNLRNKYTEENNQEELNKINNVKIFLNADHTYSFIRVAEAVEAGFDMVIFDDAGGDLEKNIVEAKKCRDFIDEYNKKYGKDILLEAELGYIGKSSKVLTELPDGLQKTSPEIAKKFVDEVKPDLLAPAVGNVHGMLKDVPDPNLDEKLCGEIFHTVNIPLVLHGASGNTKEDIQSCIKNGVAVVHVNTEIRVAYKEALKKYVMESDEVAPYKYIKEVEEAVQKTVEEKLKIFGFVE